MPGGRVGSPVSGRARTTVPSPVKSGRPSASSSVKRTRVPGSCDDLVKMKIRSSLMKRLYLATNVGTSGLRMTTRSTTSASSPTLMRRPILSRARGGMMTA